VLQLLSMCVCGGLCIFLAAGLAGVAAPTGLIVGHEVLKPNEDDSEHPGGCEGDQGSQHTKGGCSCSCEGAKPEDPELQKTKDPEADEPGPGSCEGDQGSHHTSCDCSCACDAAKAENPELQEAEEPEADKQGTETCEPYEGSPGVSEGTGGCQGGCPCHAEASAKGPDLADGARQAKGEEPEAEKLGCENQEGVELRDSECCQHSRAEEHGRPRCWHPRKAERLKTYCADGPRGPQGPQTKGTAEESRNPRLEDLVLHWLLLPQTRSPSPPQVLAKPRCSSGCGCHAEGAQGAQGAKVLVSEVPHAMSDTVVVF